MPVLVSDLGIVVSVDNPTPNVNDNVVFLLSGINYGPNSDTNVLVEALLPSGYEYVSHITTNGTYDDSTGDWAVGNHPFAQAISLYITAKVLSTGVYNFTVEISGTNNDPNPSNNISSQNVVPIPLPLELDLYITGDKTNLISVGKQFTISNDVVTGNNGTFECSEVDYDMNTNLTRMRYVNDNGETENPATGTLKFLV